MKRNTETARHWTEYTAPTTEAGKAEVAAPYREALFQDNPEAAAVLLAELYETWRDGNFDNSIANFHALFQCVRHNPHFQPEAEALRMMIMGDALLNQFAGKVRAL